MRIHQRPPYAGSAVRASTVRVGCKVNLGLRITGIRPDGYHELDSLFMPLPEPYDELDFVPGAPKATGITVTCTMAGINLQRNTVTKAYAAYAARSNFTPALHVHLRKGIPHGAGLGGGSADAAAVLCWCNANAPKPLTEDELMAVALEVGADVPFFLYNVPARVRGIGENISPCAFPWKGWHLLLLCPHVYVSSPWAYAAWDKTRADKKFTLSDASCLTSDGPRAKEENSCATWLFNDFEDVVFSFHSELRRLKESMLHKGASAAVMSGSGASLAGLFRESAKARNVAEELSQHARVFVSAL